MFKNYVLGNLPSLKYFYIKVYFRYLAGFGTDNSQKLLEDNIYPFIISDITFAHTYILVQSLIRNIRK